MLEGIDIGLLVLFVGLTIINVILNTARTIITVKGGTFMSALVSAIAFSFYTLFVIFTVCDLPMLLKVLVTGITNFIGVYIVKFFETWFRKDRLWMVDVVIYEKNLTFVKEYLNERGIQFSEMPISNSSSHVFHIYSNTQDESRNIRELLKSFNAKYVVVESKHL